MRIMLVEDEMKLAVMLKKGLEQLGYAVDVCHDGQAALDQLEVAYDDYDLALLDIALPGRSGIEICRRLRSQSLVIPIIMLTSRDSVFDKIMGLDSGADDYLIKPFDFGELAARIKSVLRRPTSVCLSKLKYGRLSLDPSSRKVMVGLREINLTAKEYAILEYLMRNAGTVLTREMILAHVWDQSFDSFSNVVDVHIASMKRKLARASHELFIQAVRGTGYRFVK